MKTTIVQNGVTKVVPDYATVSLPGFYLYCKAHSEFIRCKASSLVLSLLSSSSLHLLGPSKSRRHRYIHRRSSPPRNHSSHFENHKAAFEEGGGKDEAEADNTSQTSYREVHSEKSSA